MIQQTKDYIVFMSLAITKEIPNKVSFWKSAIYHAFITSQWEHLKTKKC